ncbi:MAG: 2-oxoglutarate dehydrogenase E1 component, partial [Desulfuromonadales bacterium]|nr:2-oxoglutarate dehydrogenase E1 component [Desulfuromonadales bacterium]
GYGGGGAARVLPVLIHGDAAFAGQGMVAETLNLSQLEGYGTGGTVHIVLNNQIGFTTTPEDSRSTRYATDVAKMLSVPIFHVHGEDSEAVLHVAGLALDYRQTFARDVIIEVICYRRQGHNEGDEPYFTQPLMYDKIKGRPAVSEIFAERLQEEGVVDAGQVATLTADIEARLEQAHGEQQELIDVVGFTGKWSRIERQWRPAPVATGLPAATLRSLGEQLTTLPEGFTPHAKIDRFLQRRRQAVHQGEGIDWSTGEALAFASLLAEGVSVRLSGQDSRRGTFSQRHAALFDPLTGEPYSPLAAVARQGAAWRVYDSMLSEAAVLGFEYGYSLETPFSLTIWEAQFGDFVNGAQVIIDQFLVSGETKWDRVSGLTLFLPHGYEGQGPEHSSGRLERFLQLAADNNIQIVNPSTPAQFFHLLRRQARQPFRRPLIVFTPKALLRHPRCVSSVEELTTGGFQEVLPLPPKEPSQLHSVLLCSGKIYYDLLEKVEQAEGAGIALLRLEQLYPLRTDLLQEALRPFADAKRFVWVQEEPRNAGAWGFLHEQLAGILNQPLQYVGRDEAASPAVGSHRLHQKEQEEIIRQAISPAGS